MFRQTHHRKAGFTLIEVLVALVLVAIVAVSLSQLLQTGQRSHAVSKHLVDMQQNARIAISSIADDFRHVSYGKDPTQPSIFFAGPDSIVFVADMMTETPGAELISYFLSPDGDPDTPNPNDTVLIKAVADSSGAPILVEPQSYGVVAGGLSIRYFNGGGEELPNPVPQPELIGEMLIEVATTETERWKQADYAQMSLSSTVYPRNLPLTPARSRPSSPQCSDPIYPNCAAAKLTWETPTTYTDGTELDFADISHFNFYLGTDPDEMDVRTRLAKTVNEWIVSELGCGTYWIAVSCVSQSGVESHKCRRQIAVYGDLLPKSTESIWLTDSTGVVIEWAPVTQFENDEPITVPLDYTLYRSEIPGFVPDDASRIATIGGATRYHDSPPDVCTRYYYAVTASACCREGAPSGQPSIERPSPPQCPTALAGAPIEGAGAIDLTWTHPIQRDDLSFLPLEEIAATWVYFDTIPGSTVRSVRIEGQATGTRIEGLSGCATYFLHAKTEDTCGHLTSASCLGNEISVHLSDGCDPEAPAQPAELALTPLDERVDLQWLPNTVDCDFYGYRILYGTSSGDYSGVEANEGRSPITVTAAEVYSEGTCRFSLTGLSACETYYVTVAAIDQCSPPHASPTADEVSGMTACIPCEISASCPSWVSSPALAHQDLHLEIYTQSGGDETLARLVPSWNSDARLMAVAYGRPLLPIWSYDGSSGENGPVDPQPSGATIDLSDVVVPSWTSLEDGQPLALFFDRDVRDVSFDLQFKNPTGGFCTAQDVNRHGAIFDDFDDGNYYGWHPLSGNWTCTAGELYQSSIGSNRLMVSDRIFTNVTFEGKVRVTSGTTAWFVFRHEDGNNFHLAGLTPSTDTVQLARVRYGKFAQVAAYNTPLEMDSWYNIKIVVAGHTASVYLDCVKVLEETDYSMMFSGRVGFRTSSAAARWDDVRCQAAAIPQ